MIPARCERARQWASLRVDDSLSSFESAILDRHLRSCDDCRTFAATVATQTYLLRRAPLAELARMVEVESASSRVVPRGIGALAAAAVALTALVLGTQGAHVPPASKTAASEVLAGPTFVVVAAVPRPGHEDLTLPRLQAQSTSVDDGPVHGYFSVPA